MAEDSDGFFERVYQVVRLVPYGRVTSDVAIARYLGSAGSARMVGWAMNQTPKGQGIPAHRVVNRIGMLTGKHYFPDPMEMERKLGAEGIGIKDDQIVDFKNVLWDPLKELEL